MHGEELSEAFLIFKSTRPWLSLSQKLCKPPGAGERASCGLGEQALIVPSSLKES